MSLPVEVEPLPTNTSKYSHSGHEEASRRVPETVLWAYQMRVSLAFQKQRTGENGERERQSREDVEGGDEGKDKLKEKERQRIEGDSENRGSSVGEGPNTIQSKRPVLQSQAHCLVCSPSTGGNSTHFFELPEFTPSSDNWVQ